MIYLGIFLLSASTLAFEINLTRIFSVAQFHHFAFMIVSLALLGFGASGAFLTLFPRIKDRDRRSTLARLGWGLAGSMIGAYALTLYVPFDSYRIAREWEQGAVLALHYVALALPFFCCGAAVGVMLDAQPRRVDRIYAANLLGSAVGCLLAVIAPLAVGGTGMVFLAAALGALAAGIVRPPAPDCARRRASLLLHGGVFIALLALAFRPLPFFEIRLSPYKSLSYALRYPDAVLTFQRWNGFSRVDVVQSSSIRSLPGRGFRCAQSPPAQKGLTVDGDDLNPITHVAPGFERLPFTDCLLTALPYRLRAGGRALVLEPGGGFDILVALSEGAGTVTAVEANPLVVEAVRAQGAWAGRLYDDPRVTTETAGGRAYARRSRARYDVVTLSLTTPQRPVASGAYSLGENYRYTVQAFVDYLSRLDDDGVLVVSRWLQTPPSESIRAFALAVEAVERAGGDPRRSLVVLRSYQQMLILARKGPFTEDELALARDFASERFFDLVYLPDIRSDEVNLHNVIPDAAYHHACVDLLEAEDRRLWYQDYPFDVRPPTDDRPFFAHFFKWGQTGDVLAMAGRTWQPFGGAGYFVLLALLALAVVAAAVLIVSPLAIGKRRLKRGAEPVGATLGYFALLGVGFLFVEIPLLQKFILFLGHPAYAMATVLFAVLLFSGVGSLLSRRASLRWVLILLPVLVGGYVMGLPIFFQATLGVPLAGRFILSVAALAPPALLMGVPFPKGMTVLGRAAPDLVAWAWGVNGAISVVASIMATLLALSGGFSRVLVVGAACYVAALFMAEAIRARPGSGSPPLPRR